VKATGTAVSTDLGGSSNHSNELSNVVCMDDDFSFEERSG